MGHKQGIAQRLYAISQWKKIGDYLNWQGQRFNGNEDPTQKNHGKAKEVCQGLGFEDLLHGNGYEATQR